MEEEHGSSQSAFFNGGKMEHIFAFNDQTKKYETDGSFSSEGAEQALLHGVFYYKIDGSNGMIQVVSSAPAPTFRVFQRHDTRGKPPGDNLIPLPPGKNPNAYVGHTYFYEEIKTDVTGKKLLKRNQDMLELVKRHAGKLVSMGREFISVEWVGKMFNRTPGVDAPIALAIHQDQIVNESEVDITRTYDGIRKLLLEDLADEPVEGLVVEHDGFFYKIRGECFQLADKNAETPFQTNRENARAPVFLL